MSRGCTTQNSSPLPQRGVVLSVTLKKKVIFEIIITSATSLWSNWLKFCVMHSPLKIRISSKNCWNWGISFLPAPPSRFFQNNGYFCQFLILRNSYSFELRQKILFMFFIQFAMLYKMMSLFFWKNSKIERLTQLENFLNIRAKSAVGTG